MGLLKKPPMKMKICTNNTTMTAVYYAYDALGRRISKYDAAAWETTFYYYNDPWQILAEYTADTTCRQGFTYGTTIDTALSINPHPTKIVNRPSSIATPSRPERPTYPSPAQQAGNTPPKIPLTP